MDTFRSGWAEYEYIAAMPTALHAQLRQGEQRKNARKHAMTKETYVSIANSLAKL